MVHPFNTDKTVRALVFQVLQNSRSALAPLLELRANQHSSPLKHAMQREGGEQHPKWYLHAISQSTAMGERFNTPVAGWWLALLPDFPLSPGLYLSFLPRASHAL